MEGPGKDEVGGKESPLLQVDPKWSVRRQTTSLAPLTVEQNSFRDALRSFFQQIRTEDPRLDFYAVYKREATEFDLDYVKKYDEDLNTTLIFVRPSRAHVKLTTLPGLVGRPVFCSQFRFRHRRLSKASTRSQRSICGSTSRNPPHS